MIELGTSLGISATYQSAANPNGKLFTLEGSENIADIAEKNFNTLGFKNIFLQRGEFSLSLPKVLNENKKIDYVFFDGNHRQQATLDYFNLCLNHTNEKTFFVFDDINWSNEMQNAWKIICNHPSVTVSIDLFMMGIIFFDKSLSKQHFKLRF
jgi:predicted O-methyltransferase YrrM